MFMNSGNMSFPLALLAFGPEGLPPAISLAGSAIRIGGGMAIAWGVVTLFGIDGLNQKIILLSSGMPAAVINFVVSHRYNVNSDLVASTVALSTFISIFTTPLLLLWIM